MNQQVQEYFHIEDTVDTVDDLILDTAELLETYQAEYIDAQSAMESLRELEVAIKGNAMLIAEFTGNPKASIKSGLAMVTAFERKQADKWDHKGLLAKLESDYKKYAWLESFVTQTDVKVQTAKLTPALSSIGK